MLMKMKLISGALLAAALSFGACGPAYVSGGAEVVVESEPPPPQVEVRPVAPYAEAVWIEGYWRWTGREYVWVRGHWDRPRHGWVWVAHHWERRGNHWHYVPGHWRRV
jgi:YXWGXW repeat-containing protein